MALGLRGAGDEGGEEAGGARRLGGLSRLAGRRAAATLSRSLTRLGRPCGAGAGEWRRAAEQRAQALLAGQPGPVRIERGPQGTLVDQPERAGVAVARDGQPLLDGQLWATLEQRGPAGERQG